MENIFDDKKKAIEQLKRDKHTLLEGYVTEFIFEKQFLLKNQSQYTKGWWMATYKDVKIFFIVKSDLNSLDEEIINILEENNECWKVDLKEEELVFSNKTEILSKEEFVKKHKLLKIRDNMTASLNTRNKDRQSKSISFFEKNNLLKKIAVERYFANNFLTLYFNGMVNIDCFSKDKNDQLNVIEIKFKYETRDKCFGINTGQMNMFNYLSKYNFKVNHFILYNSTKDKDITIFGFLALKIKKYWLLASVEKLDTQGKSIAPEYTSVSGNFKQEYFKLKKEDFKGKIELEYKEEKEDNNENR